MLGHETGERYFCQAVYLLMGMLAQVSMTCMRLYTALWRKAMCSFELLDAFFQQMWLWDFRGFFLCLWRSVAINATTSIDSFITFCGEENLSCCRWKMNLTTGWADHCLLQPVTSWLTQFQWFHSQSASEGTQSHFNQAEVWRTGKLVLTLDVLCCCSC